MNIKVVSIDLAKLVFQLCVLGQDDKVLSNKKIARGKLLDAVRQLPEGTVIAMEACASSHYWGRTFQAMGYQVRLIPTQHVKAFGRSQKNDANDAVAICEAAFRPNLHFVPIKTVEQQDLKALQCVRQRLVEQRTALANQIRGLAAEYGVCFSKQLRSLRTHLPDALEDAENGLSFIARRLLRELADDLRLLTDDIESVTRDMETLAKKQPRWSALIAVPGFGPIITAALLAEIGNGEQFENGRQASAWLGLVPKQYSSGGHSNLGGMTKNGNRNLRTLVIHGARSVLRYADKRHDALGQWLTALINRRGKNKAVVALANKWVRVAWSIIKHGDEFDMKKAFHAA